MRTGFGFTVSAVILVFACMGASAFAGVEIAPECTVFAHYYYNLSFYPGDWYEKYGENDWNGVDLTRAYLGAKAELSDHWEMRMIGDVEREDEYRLVPLRDVNDEDGDGDTEEVVDYALVRDEEVGEYGVYLKYAYLTYRPFEYLGVKFGQYGTPWIEAASKAWGYRFVAKPFTDKYEKEPVADLGVSLFGKLPLNLGSYHIAQFNGEGYKRPEWDEGKAWYWMLLLTPLKMTGVKALEGLAVGSSYRWEKVDAELEHRYYLFTALVHYSYDITDYLGVNLGFEYASSYEKPERTSTSDEKIDSMGYSGYVGLTLFNDFGIFGRYDFYDPNTKNSEGKQIGYRDELTCIIAGVSYQPIRYVKLAADYQTTSYTAKVIDDKGDEVTKPADSFLYFHTEFKF